MGLFITNNSNLGSDSSHTHVSSSSHTCVLLLTHNSNLGSDGSHLNITLTGGLITTQQLKNDIQYVYVRYSIFNMNM